jgi:diguanylate cyclase (GGDEF)-like protein/PAS domain S-box-containing protein
LNGFKERATRVDAVPMRVLETLGRAFASSRIGMSLVDLDGRLVEVNPALCRMFGRTEQELIGRAIVDLTHPDDTDSSAERVDRLADGHGPEQTFEKRYVRGDGSILWARVTATVAFDPDGRPEAIFSQIEDVTARKHAERLLHASDERFERVFEDAPVGMTLNSPLVAEHGRILRANAAFGRILGVEPEALVGRLPHTLLHPDDVGLGRDEWYAMLAGQIRTFTFHRRHLRADGTLVVLRTSSSIVRDVDGEALYVVNQAQDVTASWEAERRFEAAFEDAPIAMVLSSARPDEGGRALRVNQAMCEMLRTNAHTLLSEGGAVFFAESGRAEAVQEYRELLSGERPRVASERELLRLDGTTVWAAVSASLVRDDAGAPHYVIAQFQDIDARKRGERLLQAAEGRLRGAFEDSAIPALLHDLDGRLLRVNGALCELLGHEAEALVGETMLLLVHPEEIDGAWAAVERLRSASGRRLQRELRCLRADGTPLWVRVTASLVGEGEADTYVVAQLEDVSAEREARRNAQLRLAQQTAVAWLGQRALAEDDLGALFDAAVGVVATTCQAPYTGLAVRDGEQLRLVASVGWPDDAPPIAFEPRRSHSAYTVHSGTPVIVDDMAVEHRFEGERLGAYGISSGMSVAVAGESGAPFGSLSVHSTERRAFTTDDIAFLASVANVLTGAIRRAAAARELRHQSLHDPLTQLPNRTLMLDRLRQAIARSRRDGSILAVLFCDMDDFKYVNDTLGHDAGDRLLSALAPRLQAALRVTDTLARFGGDEFVVLCEGLSEPAEVVAVADRLLAACAEPIDLAGSEFVPTCSIGIAMANAGSCTDPEALLRDADVAMYRAKAGGKGRYELFDTAMREQTLERVGLLGDLRHATARGELRLEFQPIVSLRRRELAGLEALVRWEHPTRGRLMPDDFIGLADDSGLIHEIGRWVIDEAVRQTAVWKRAGTPALDGVMTGVNVSWRQIGTVVRDVADALERHGLDPSYFCVEMTESAVLEDPQRATEAIGGLRRLGVHLGLDDFGTGQSSLSVLRDFQLHTLKLDRSFLAAGDWDIVRAVTQMARSLDMLVVAEGVERADQDAAATELGCDFGQGWLYGRALPAAELEIAAAELSARL